MEKHGIKETKEALLAMFVLGKFIAERAKDGVDLNDAMALFTKLVADPDFKGKLDAGVKGYEQIGNELGDVSFAEGLELAGVLLEMLKELKA